MPARPALLAAGASGLAVAFALAPVASAAQAAPAQTPASIGLSEDGHLAAGRLAADPVGPVTPDYGARKVYVGTQASDGSYYLPGSVFTVTETPEGGGTPIVTTCTDASDSPTVQPCGYGPFGLNIQYPGSSVSVAQTSAPSGYLPDPTPQTVPVCTDPQPDPIFNTPACVSNLTFTMTPVAPPPAPTVTAAKKNLTIAKDTAVTVDPDTQVDRKTINPTAVGIYGPAHGTVSVVENGAETVAGKTPLPVTGPFTLKYTPTAGFVGPDAFKYYVRTPGGKTAFVTVTLSIKGARPTAVSDSGASSGGQPATIDALANDKDNGGGTIKLTSVTRPAHGTVKIVGGKILYTPAEGYKGTDRFRYTASSYSGLSNLGTVTVTVTP